MSKRCRDPDFDGTTAGASGFKTVFVATSLDTHLALSLSFSDTVADFKRKILLNHEQCFPESGALTIHSLKVKYHGNLYHLHESDMVVSSAFNGSERRWSLFVDASSSLKDVKEQSSLDPYDKGKFEYPAIDAFAWKSPGESSRHTGLEVGHVDGTSREGFSSMVRHDLVENDLRSKDDSKYQTDKVHYHTSYENETQTGDGLDSKKKRKVKKSLDVAGESALNTAPHTTTSHRSNDETTDAEDSFVGAGSKVSRDVQIGVIDAGDSPYNTDKVHYHTSYENETQTGDGLDSKKKRKVKKSLDVAGESALNTAPHTTTSHRSNDETTGAEDSFVGAGSKVSRDVQIGVIDAGDSPYQTDKVHYHTSYENETKTGDGLDFKKKRKVKKSLDVAGESALNTAPHTTTSHRSNDETTGAEDSFVGAGSKVSRDVQIGVIDAGDSPYNTDKVHYHTSYENETQTGDGLDSQKKRKVKKSLDVAVESALNTAPHTTTSHRSNDETTGAEDSFVGAGSKVSRDVQIGVIDAGDSPYNTLFSGKKTSGLSAPESHVFEQEEVYRHRLDLSIRNQVSDMVAPEMSDMENVSQEKSVVDRRENMTSSNVPSEQLHEEHPAVNTTTKKKKRKKQHNGTNSYTPDDHDATSKSETMLQEGSVLQEACGSQVIGTGNYGKEDDKSMLAPAASQKDYMEEDGRLTSNSDVCLSESVKPSDIVEATPAKKELVVCLGILNNSSKTGESKSKIRKVRKSTLHKQDHLDIEQDLSAPSGISAVVESVSAEAHIDDELKRDENVLSQSGPNKSEENRNETNLNEKEPVLNVGMENLEGGKSGCSRKKKKKKSATHNDFCVVERTKDANDTSVLKVASDILTDQSIFSCIKGKEASKMFSPTNSHKYDNTASDDDNVQEKNPTLTEVDHIYSKNDDLDLNSGKESNINQSQVRASMHDQVNMEQAKEADCLPMDQPDGELENKGTTKKEKKGKEKRTGNSTCEGLVIPEVNQQTLDDKEVASLIVNLGNVDFLKVSGSDEKASIDRSGASELGHGKNACLKCSGELEQLVQNADVPEVPYHQIGVNCEVGHAAEVEPNNAFASEGENGLVNFRRYFVPGEDHREAASTGKVEGESNVVEGAEKADEHTFVPEGKHRSSKALENQKHSSGINSDDSKHEYPSSKERKRKNVNKKEISTSSKKRSIAPISSDVKIQTLKKSIEPILINGSVSTVTVPRNLEENDGSLTSSTFNSVSKDSKKALVNKSSHKKQTGSNNSARDIRNRKTALSSKKPNPGSMAIDMALRSSNRIKKAKLNASQSEAADSESQQVDFVPESQPIL